MVKNIICLLIAATMLSGCKKLDEFTNFNIPLEQSIVVPANPIAGLSARFPVGEFETNIDALLDQHNSNLDEIEEIFLESMRIEVETPSDSDLDYLANVSILIQSSTSPLMKVAWKEPVPANTGKTLDLEVWDADMKTHFTQDVISIMVDVEADQATTEEQTVNIKAVFRVNAKVLGI